MVMVEYKNPVDVAVFKIFGIFDVFRNNNRVGFIEEQVQIVLLFLSLYKDGLINSGTLHHYDLLHEIEENKSASNHQSEPYESYRTIIQNLIDSLSKIDDHSFKRICDKLSEIDREFLTENFPEIFDNVVYRISQSQGRYAGEFIQPVEITRFICALAELPEKASVFNPFAGLASFGVYFDQGQDYLGQELNLKTWILGALRILAYKRPGTSNYVCDDSILHWPAPSKKFDLIVANPPFGMRLGNQYREVEPELRTIEQFLLEKGVQSLKPEGKLIALLPQGILFRGMHEQRLREYLVDRDLIDTIISLPGGLLLNTGIPLVIIVLSKAKKMPGKVRFVDAKRYVKVKGPREKVLNDYALNSIILGTIQGPDVISIVDNEQIQVNNYNLSVPRYFQKEIDGVKLGNILEFVSGQRRNLPESGKLIRIRDLKDDKLDFKLDLSNVEVTELKRPDIHLISESCLLLSIRWRTLKPTSFEFKGEPLARTQDILSFKVNESKVDNTYLINELHSDYVQEQLESYRLGASVMPFLRKDDLLEVVIKLPSLEEQRAKVQGIFELSDKIKSLQEEKNELAHDKSIKQFNEFASLKHTLGRPRQNILDWSDNLLHFLDSKKDEFDSLNKAFIEFYEIDIISALKEIKRDVNFITDVLEKGENGFVIKEFEKQIIPLSDINNIINELSSNSFKFKIKKLLIKGEKLKERGIYGNSTLFKTLLDNLLTNASKYGFDKKEVGNEVVIELTEVEDILSVDVRNNGKPFPKNFDREKFITKYSTADTSSGSGLGGYDIHRIAIDFKNPEWELSLNEDPFYPVKFKFQFPIKLIN
jgi:type I restriction enzyme M protein